MRGRMGTSMHLWVRPRKVNSNLSGWRKKRRQVLDWLYFHPGVSEAAQKFHLKEETIYKMIRYGSGIGNN